jgi:nanoRNase/pAp phosphatase (c-di-AMP/oligoRNAs hydrolase)
MSNNRIHVFTDCDLDGAGAYHILCACLQQKLNYTVTRVVDVQEKIGAWLKYNNIQDYDHIYILDLDISQYPKLAKQLDHPNVTIVDHHTSHVTAKHLYTSARAIIVEETSATKLVYKYFDGSSHLNSEQKLLVLMVDDYDSYQFKVKNSHELNIVFWSYQGDRVAKFIDDFGSGFTGFNQQHINIISFYIKKLNNIKSNLDVHVANLSIQGRKRRVVAVFADSCINDIADYIIKNHKSDIGIVVNLKSNKVSLRRCKECDVDLSIVAKNIFDEGGGHQDAAGGVICDKFMMFTKLFQPMKIRNLNG